MLKMQHKLMIRLTLLVAAMVCSMQLAAQVYVLDPESTKVSVDGTSTLHDWTAAVNEVEGKVLFNQDFLKQKKKAKEVATTAEMKFKVGSMDGGRGATMNTKIYNALKEEEHPYILFNSTSPISITGAEKNGKFAVSVPGKLVVAGVEKAATIELNGERDTDGTFRFTGVEEIKFSDFGLERPSAMFGQIVTGDELKINFELVLVEGSAGK